MRIVQIVFFLFLTACTFAGNIYFTNESGDNLWNTPGNWRDGSWVLQSTLPDFSTHTVNINNGVHPKLTTSSVVKEMYCPYSNVAGTVTGFEITGSLNVNAGLTMGVTAGTMGVVDVNSGTIYVGGVLAVGSAGSHVLNIHDGFVDTAQLYLTQFNSSASAQVNISGNSTVNIRTKLWGGFGSKNYWSTYGKDNAHMDISGDLAKVTVPYAQQLEIRDYINMGIITANGGAGKVVLRPDPLTNTVKLTAAEKPSGVVTRVMPLGDSITYGIGSTPSGINGYRKSLYEMLETNGYNVDFIGSQLNGDFNDCDHEGHPGWYSYQIRDNISNWLASTPADIVLLHIGTNDIVNGTQNSNTIGEILDRIDTYESTNNVKITVVLARIILQVGDVHTNAFNNEVETMAQSRIAQGDEIIMVDMEHALTYPGDMADTLHPNDAGYQKMAQKWYEVMATLIQPAVTPPICVNPPSMDTNNDCKVDFADFVVFAKQWLTCGYDIQSSCWQ